MIYSYEHLKQQRKFAIEREERMSKVKYKLPPGITWKMVALDQLDARIGELKSHMDLQVRNEKLRRKNSRLIGIITSIRSALNGRSKG